MLPIETLAERVAEENKWLRILGLRDSGSGLCSRPGTGLDPEGHRAAAQQAPHRPQAVVSTQISMFMEAAE